MFKLKNLTEAINKAKKECEYNNKVSYSKKVRELANEYMSKNNLDTLNTSVGKHKVIFHKGISGTHESITMTVDGKNYSSSNNIDDIICALDHIGPEYEKARNKMQKMDKIKDNAKATSRVAKVDITRKILNEPFKSAAEGNSLLVNLMRLIGQTLRKSVEQIR